MRTSTTVLLATLLLTSVTTTFAAPVPELPICDLPDWEEIQRELHVVICPVTVEDGEEEEYNNDTYAFNAEITVEDGGRVEIILSDVSVGPGGAIRVEAGGSILIDSSDLTAPPTTMPVIRLDAGAEVEIMDSDFSSITLEVAADGAVIDDNRFTLGSPAVRLEAYSGVFSDNEFQRNTVAVNVTGGSPEIFDLEFHADAMGIEIHDSHVNIHDLVMIDLSDGVRMTWSQGTLGPDMAMDDASLPPNLGIEVLDTTGTVEVLGNSIINWGTGIFYCRADMNVHDNFFSGNGEDVVSCDD